MNLAKKICSLCITLVAMLNSAYATNYIVSTKTDLQAKYTAALPSDTVIVANGTYDWGQLVLSNSNGTITSNWIVIKAQTLNGVVFTGSTYIQFGGKRIMITGFKFANGNAGFNDVIQFRSSTSISSYAQYCRLNNITIENYSSDSTGAAAGLSSASDNKWVSLYGIRNRIDHCTFIDKYNGGATVVVWYESSIYPQQSPSTYHLIDSNYFNKRSFISGNGGESIRVGTGLTSPTYGYNVVEYNLFENMTQEEPEIISNKSGFNTYRYNTFKNCAGGLTLRRGRYCSVYGNFFIVNKSTVIDDYGIRIIDKGHKVFNNYIEGVNSNKNSLTSMRCPIILYNGTNSANDTTNPSLATGYMPGDSCIIAFNTIVNCEGGAGISLGFTDNGSNTFQPLGITIANNLIKMTTGQAAYNPPTNTSLTYSASGNIYNAPSGVGLSSSTGLTSATLTFGSRVNGILTPPSLVQDVAINTSSYSSILNGLDVHGLTRSSIYDVGCDEINSTGSVIATPLDSTQVGSGMPLIAIIKSFTPSIAYNGTTVTIKGTNFVNVSNVNFGGINATNYTLQNDSTITAVVSSGTSGNVNITANGFVSTITGFTFCSPLTSTTNVSICPSQLPYSWNGNRIAAGTYTFTTTNSQGCDSTATFNLTVKTNTTSTINVSICPSQLPYSWNGSRASAGTYTFTTTNSQGCDSTATLNLTVKTNTTSTTNVSICPSQLPYSWNGSRTVAGTYTFTTTNSQGCDSTATLNLTVKTNTTSTSNVSICPSALPYSWNGTRTVGGTYTFTTTNSQGCDSTATLNLTVKTNTTSTTAVSRCPSQMPFLWNGINRTTAGTYTFTTTNSQGCDSTATLNLTVKTNATSTSNVSICPSALPYSWNGSRTSAGTYTFTTTNSQGCDSTATLNLTVKTNTTSTTNVSICPNALPYSWNGSKTVAGTYIFTTTNSQGCDSTATLNLTVKTNTTSTTNVSICPSALPYSWNGSRVTAGTYTFTTTNSQGCDSTATLNLTVKTNTTSTTNVSICPSALPYSWNGSRTVAGTYTFTTTNSQGCDSTATLNLTVKTNTTSTTAVSRCPSQMPFLWNGINRTTAGTYTFTTTNSQGCDSITILNLTVKTNTTSTTNVSICPSQLPYSWNGSRTLAGTYTYTTMNIQGCDSVAILNLTVTSLTPSLSISTATTSICSGSNTTFTANATNGGPSPNYQWKKNGVDAGSGSTITFLSNTLSNNDVISCVLTANNICQTTATANSNAIQMTVKQSPSVAQISNGISTITSATLCTLGSSYNYYCATGFGTWSSSNPGVASVAGRSLAAVVTANTNGTATISYNVAAANGCVSTSSILLTLAQQAAPTAISGTNSICVNATTALSSTAPDGTTGVWSSSNNRGIISIGGVYTGQNAGTGEARYTVTNTVTGCKAFAAYAITINLTPVIPTIAYAPGQPNPQLGAPAGSFCVGKKFRVTATPNVPLGVWSTTGVASLLGLDTISINGVGAGTIKYTYTSVSGCVNSRTMSGNGFTCAARGVILNNQLETTNDFSVYPNPSTNYVNVQIEKLIPNSYLSINDIYGKLVQKIEIKNLITNISTEKFSNGIYIIQVIENNIKSCHHLITVSK